MKALFGLYKQSFSNLQRNIWILSIAMFINRSGSMVLLFTSLYLTNVLHFSIAQAGFILSFYGMGSILGSYFGGWLTDRKKYFDIMFTSLLVSGCILLFILIAKEQWSITCVIFLYAFTSDTFRPANSAAIGIYSTPENRTRSVSLVRLAINLGFSVGPAVGGFVALYLGYKWLFVIDAFTSFGAAALLYFYLPRKNNAEPHRKETSILSDSKTSAYRDVPYLLFILLVACYGICFFQIFASMPQYFSKVCNYTEDTIGLLLALNGILVVVIEMPLVSFLENKKSVFYYIIRGGWCIPLAFLIMQLGGGFMIAAIIYTVILTFSEIFAMPFMMNYTLTHAPKARQGQYSALYSMAYGIANIVAPLLGLGIAGMYGFNTLFVVLIAIGTLTTLGFVWLKKLN